MVRKRIRRCSGTTLVTTLAGAALLCGAVLALLRTTVQGLALEASNRETAVALRVANDMIEELRGLGAAQAFTLHNAEPADDPGGAGTAPGARFAVAQLRAAAGEASAWGRVEFPTASGSPGVLDETVASPFHGAPADMDLDGLATGRDVTATYVVLPVAVHIEWQGALGPRTLTVSTVLAR